MEFFKLRQISNSNHPIFNYLNSDINKLRNDNFLNCSFMFAYNVLSLLTVAILLLRRGSNVESSVLFIISLIHTYIIYLIGTFEEFQLQNIIDYFSTCKLPTYKFNTHQDDTDSENDEDDGYDSDDSFYETAESTIAKYIAYEQRNTNNSISYSTSSLLTDFLNLKLKYLQQSTKLFEVDMRFPMCVMSIILIIMYLLNSYNFVMLTIYLVSLYIPFMTTGVYYNLEARKKF